MERTITPEILDHLHPDDPRAVRSRKDLQRINQLMGNAQCQARAIAKLLKGKKAPRVLEIGCGDGTFMLGVLRVAREQGISGGELVLLDQQSVVSNETLQRLAGIGWQTTLAQADLFQWLPNFREQKFDLAACNLFLHHFRPEPLRKLFQAVAGSCESFISTEPRRNSFCLAITKCLWVIGCNDVTRHDAPVSIHAGFNGRDLQELWPVEGTENFTFEEFKQGLFTHYFSARRKG